MPVVATDAQRDIETASYMLAQESDTLRRLIGQAAGRDPNAIAALSSELASAKEWRAYYVAGVPGIDTGEIDTVISQAEAAVGGGRAGSSIIQRDGLHLGKLTIPWIGVAAAGLFVGAALLIPRRRRRSRGE